MITWFQRTFGKHHKWVLLTFMVLMLFSFIVGIGAVPRGSMTPDGKKDRLFLGFNVNDQQLQASYFAAIQFTQTQLYGEQMPQDNNAYNALFVERMALTKLADDWRLPDPSAKQLEDYVKTLPAFQDSKGNFSPDAYLAFRDKTQQGTPAERDLATATLKEDARLDRVKHILGGPGYTVPSLAQTFASIDKLKLNLDVATLDFTKFDPKIEDPKDDVLQQIFTKTPERFQKAPQAHLSYAKFPIPAIGEPTATQLSDYAAAHKDAYPDVKPGAPLSDKDKTALTDAWKNAQKSDLMKPAAEMAMKLAREMTDLKVTRPSAAFDALLKKYGVTLQTLPTLEEGKPAPTDSPITDDILQQVAFGYLNPQQPVSPPVPMKDGAAVLLLDELDPPRAPTFAEARADVLAAYRESQKEQLFTTHGEEIRTAITKAMGEGKTFAEAASAQGMTVKNYPDVSSDTIHDVALNLPFETNAKGPSTGPLAGMTTDIMKTLLNSTGDTMPLIWALQPNEVSRMMTMPGTGAIFHVVKREVPVLAADAPEVKTSEESFKRMESNVGAALYLDRLIQSANENLKQADSTTK